VEVQRDIRREIRVSHRISGERLELEFSEHRFCRHVQYDVERVSLVRTNTNPGANYYMMLGSLIAACPFPRITWDLHVHPARPAPFISPWAPAFSWGQGWPSAGTGCSSIWKNPPA
jgi:hypothetical protein